MTAKTDGVSLAEALMRKGWWAEAEKALSRPDVAPADRFLESCALACRRECWQWLDTQCRAREIPASVRAKMLRRFDHYTAQWVIERYSERMAAQWQPASEKANALTD